MRLILFDIDGTLVLTGGAGMRAMNRACEDLVGHGDALKGVALAGRTDWIILHDVLTRHGMALDAARLEELRRRYVQHLVEEIQLPGKGVKDMMPGVRALLETLRGRTDASLGLLTGNFLEGARIKLEYFDLWKYFGFGAFGGDSADRNDLVPVAIQRARESGIAPVVSSEVMVVGDTPHDVACARAAGATPIAVATGSYTVDQLRDSGAEIVFDDLSDTDAFLRLI
ncbi:MAG TPA: HAD family hydrolase [Vicinamibacterales bacterium]|jgi:phosphoglycolate phosphatase-like HAD superfamily hydrolase|nr:HAD family hydrolase [Vicinamibacterales bacterium]